MREESSYSPCALVPSRIFFLDMIQIIMAIIICQKIGSFMVRYKWPADILNRAGKLQMDLFPSYPYHEINLTTVTRLVLLVVVPVLKQVKPRAACFGNAFSAFGHASLALQGGEEVG